MRKIVVFLFLALSLQLSAQFKLGGTVLGGITKGNDGTKQEVYDFVGGGGVVAEMCGMIGYLRTGYIFQSPQRQLVPLHAYLRFGGSGAFAGGGVSLTTNSKANFYDIVLGKKFHRNGDFSLVFSKPYSGGESEPIYSLRITFFPFTTCGDVCIY